MKTSGIVFVLVGIGLIGVGVHSFVKVGRRVLEARVVLTAPISPGMPVVKEATVSTERKCQVSVEVLPDLKSFGEPDVREIQKDYPFSVVMRVLDESGKEIVSDRFDNFNCMVTANGWTGSVTFSGNSSKFDPPASGKLTVEVRLDNLGRSRILPSEVKVYDTVSDHTIPMVYGVLFTITGAVITLLGGGLFFLGLLNRRPVPTSQGAVPQQPS